MALLPFLNILQIEALIPFVLDYLFKDICIEYSLGRYNDSFWNKGKICLLFSKINNFSLRGKGQVDLLPTVKDLVFLSYNTTHCICSCHLALFASIYE